MDGSYSSKGVRNERGRTLQGFHGIHKGKEPQGKKPEEIIGTRAWFEAAGSFESVVSKAVQGSEINAARVGKERG